MSLLIGANLSDRIYICADTRISIRTDSGLKTKHDNLYKLAYLGDLIAVGCVGSPQLGAFVIDQIKKKKAPTAILEFESWLRINIQEIVHQYLITPRKNSRDNRPTNQEAHASLIFFGIDKTSKKKLNGEKFFAAVKKYQTSQQNRIDTLFGGKPIEKFTPDEFRQLTYEMQKPQMGLKGVIAKALTENKRPGDLELPMFNQHMFVLDIRSSLPGREIEFKNIGYGEIVVRGAGYDESHISETFFGDIDLTIDSGDINKDLIPFIYEIYERYGGSIGGAVTNIAITGNEILSVFNSIFRMKNPSGPKEVLYQTQIHNGEPHRFENNAWHRLQPFTELLDISEDSTGELVL